MAALPAAHRATLWPYRPKRLPDELLSRWLWRAARGLGAPPRRFAHDAIGARLADIDREIDDATIARLAFLSGQSEEHLLRGTMRADAPLASSDQRESVLQALLRHGDLVLNRTHRGRSKPIIQYCPICLGRGDAAYLRRGWRFSIEVACFNDGCFLLDACWRCGALVDPLSSAHPSADFLCVKCGDRLAAAPSLHMPETVTDQTILYQTLFTLLFSFGRDHITIRGEEYIEELSSGALRGTNPANAADPHNAIISEAWRICRAAARANARFGTRRWAKARTRERAKQSPGQADRASPRSEHEA
ncbi:MAG: TniQ family protein [Alphaproteobacteria bacterium]|nr:TniQ family protein [Alphaproteobacteria bacterium]